MPCICRLNSAYRSGKHSFSTRWHRIEALSGIIRGRLFLAPIRFGLFLVDLTRIVMMKPPL